MPLVARLEGVRPYKPVQEFFDFHFMLYVYKFPYMPCLTVGFRNVC